MIYDDPRHISGTTGVFGDVLGNLGRGLPGSGGRALNLGNMEHSLPDGISAFTPPDTVPRRDGRRVRPAPLRRGRGWRNPGIGSAGLIKNPFPLRGVGPVDSGPVPSTSPLWNTSRMRNARPMGMGLVDRFRNWAGFPRVQ